MIVLCVRARLRASEKETERDNRLCSHAEAEFPLPGTLTAILLKIRLNSQGRDSRYSYSHSRYSDQIVLRAKSTRTEQTGRLHEAACRTDRDVDYILYP